MDSRSVPKRRTAASCERLPNESSRACGSSSSTMRAWAGRQRRCVRNPDVGVRFEVAHVPACVGRARRPPSPCRLRCACRRPSDPERDVQGAGHVGDRLVAEAYVHRVVRLHTAGGVGVAAAWAAAADFDVVTEADQEVVPAAGAHLDAVQVGGQTLVAESQLRCVAVDRSDGEGRARAHPVGEEVAGGDGPVHRCRSRRLIDVDHARFRGVEPEREVAAGVAGSGDVGPPRREAGEAGERIEQRIRDPRSPGWSSRSPRSGASS